MTITQQQEGIKADLLNRDRTISLQNKVLTKLQSDLTVVTEKTKEQEKIQTEQLAARDRLLVEQAQALENLKQEVVSTAEKSLAAAQVEFSSQLTKLTVSVCIQSRLSCPYIFQVERESELLALKQKNESILQQLNVCTVFFVVHSYSYTSQSKCKQLRLLSIDRLQYHPHPLLHRQLTPPNIKLFLIFTSLVLLS